VAVMSSAVQRMVAQQLFLLGFIQSLFESSMSASCCPHVYSTARAVTPLHARYRLLLYHVPLHHHFSRHGRHLRVQLFPLRARCSPWRRRAAAMLGCKVQWRWWCWGWVGLKKKKNVGG
jgi:hypothetical protein